jgi:hypothetical protein
MKAIELLNNLKVSCTTNSSKPNKEFVRKREQLLAMVKNKELLKMDNYLYQAIYLPIYEVLNRNEQELFKNAVFDSVSINKINASTIKTDENEYLIIFTNRLMGLLHTWNETQIKFVISKDTSKEDIAKAFAPIIDSYLTPNSNNALPIFSLDEFPIENLKLAAAKTIMHEQFILAHEMAHVYLGHFKDVRGVSSFVSESFIPNFYENSENIEKELEADIQAIKWLSRMRGADVALTLYAEVLVIFHYIECNTGFPSSKASHPASLIRLINLKEKCNEYFVNCMYSLEEIIFNFL